VKSLFAGLLLIAAFAAAGCAPLGMSATMQIHSAPPPAVEFNVEPHFSYLAHRRVSVIADDGFGYDMFSTGGTYYLYSGGNWYRSQAPRGPFVAIEMRRVPRQIFDVDDQDYHWRSHPEGWHGGRQKDKGDQRPGGDNRGNRGNGR
jgi:hypothetical protein